MISKYKNEYCCEDISLIENYDKAIADDTQIWHCHHRLETHDENGNRRKKDLTIDDLIKIGKYYDIPAKELIYLPPYEHHLLHNERQSERLTEESHMKMREKAKGRHIPRTVEWCRKLSESNKGKKLSEFHKQRLRENHVGMRGQKKPGYHWFNNGVTNTRAKVCPEGYKPGMIR